MDRSDYLWEQYERLYNQRAKIYVQAEEAKRNGNEAAYRELRRRGDAMDDAVSRANKAYSQTQDPDYR